MNLRNLLLSVAALAAAPLFATTYYVTPEGAGTKDGLSKENAFGVEEFKAQAIKNANGDIYELAAGTYIPSDFIIFKKATFATINGSTEGRTILSGDRNSDGVASEGDLQHLIKFQTNTGAGATDRPVVINNIDFTCVYTNIEEKDPISDTNDKGVEGIGALYLDNCGDATISGCNFYDNKAVGKLGGAASHCRRSTVKFINCVFSDNSANYRGGALRITSDKATKGETTLENCVFKNNTNANDLGGAIFQGYGHYLNIVNSTFYGNKASSKGAAIYANSSNDHKCEVRIVNSTIAGNTITGEIQDGQVTSTQYANIKTVNSVIVSNNENTADFYFRGDTATDKFSFESKGFNYVGTVVDEAAAPAAKAEAATEPAAKINWLPTDNVSAENTYASIFGENKINENNVIVPVKYVAGASGSQVSEAVKDWGLPAGIDVTKDQNGATRADGMTPGAGSFTEKQIKDFTTSVITTIDDAADTLHLVKIDNGVYTIEGATEGITVYTVNGATVAATPDNTVDISSFANGLYILKSGNTIFKVLK